MNGTVVNIINYYAVDPGSVSESENIFFFFLYFQFVSFLFRIFNLFLFCFVFSCVVSFFLSMVKGVIILFH